MDLVWPMPELIFSHYAVVSTSWMAKNIIFLYLETWALGMSIMPIVCSTGRMCCTFSPCTMQSVSLIHNVLIQIRVQELVN